MILYYIIFVQIPINALWIAAIGFSLSIAAYSCEIFRSGLDAVDQGQREAAIALGMSPFQTFWTVIAPQAAIHSLPVLKGEIVSTVKMTSVVGFISVEDLTRAGDLIRSSSFDAFFPLILVAILYFIVTWGFVAFLTAIEWNVDPRRQKERFLKQVQRYTMRQDRKGAANHESVKRSVNSGTVNSGNPSDEIVQRFACFERYNLLGFPGGSRIRYRPFRNGEKYILALPQRVGKA